MADEDHRPPVIRAGSSQSEDTRSRAMPDSGGVAGGCHVIQSASRVVPVGADSDVSSPAISLSSSSRVSTTSRSSSPTSRVRPKPKDGGVCTRRTRPSTDEANRRSKASPGRRRRQQNSRPVTRHPPPSPQHKWAELCNRRARIRGKPETAAVPRPCCSAASRPRQRPGLGLMMA